MHLIKSFFITICLIFCAHSSYSMSPKFHCYSVPGSPVQTYEFSTLNKCLETQKTHLNTSGEKPIVCLYQAVCSPVYGPDASKEPTKRNIPEVQTLIATGAWKASALFCQGKGQVVDGNLIKAECPTPSRCREDLVFNYAALSITPMAPEGIQVPNTESRNLSTESEVR